MEFIRTWLWEGRRKYVYSLSLLGLWAWLAAYFVWESFGKSLCPTREAFEAITKEYEHCVNWYLYTIHNPFFFGHFLKTVILLPLLFLFPFSTLTFRAWATFSALLIPTAIYSIITAPTYGQFFDKVMTSTTWGAFYVCGTLSIIILIPLGEYLYKKFKAK